MEQLTLFKKDVITDEINFEPIEEMIKCFPEYEPFKGFYDLRCFKLSKKIFKKLWHIQNILYEMNNNREYYQRWHPGQWQKAQELSAEYQGILFQI
jgi:hypothetical protein